MAEPELTEAIEQMRTLLEIAERAFTIASFQYYKGSKNHTKLMALGNSAISSVFAMTSDDEDN